MIVDSALYRKGERVPRRCDDHDYAALLAAADEAHDFVWVGLADPTEASSTTSPTRSGCTRSRSRTRSTPTSGPSSTATTTACS